MQNKGNRWRDIWDKKQLIFGFTPLLLYRQTSIAPSILFMYLCVLYQWPLKFSYATKTMTLATTKAAALCSQFPDQLNLYSFISTRQQENNTNWFGNRQPQTDMLCFFVFCWMCLSVCACVCVFVPLWCPCLYLCVCVYLFSSENKVVSITK